MLCASPYSNAVKVGLEKDIIQFGGQLATTMDHILTSTEKECQQLEASVVTSNLDYKHMRLLSRRINN